mmetsp:Transcript_3783/g.5367  ORF Transcript_3783/g.5367 Transcript_3783/m.5367 type:complete len:97 (+) Transcript_3783:552-842(+)
MLEERSSKKCFWGVGFLRLDEERSVLYMVMTFQMMFIIAMHLAIRDLWAKGSLSQVVIRCGDGPTVRFGSGLLAVHTAKAIHLQFLADSFGRQQKL